MNSIQSSATNVYRFVENLSFTLQSLSQVVKNAKKVAIPAILLIGATSIQTTEAGPIVYAICVAGCIAINPTWAAICPIICAPGGLSPSP